jgi:hypothetical protein
MKIPTCLPIRKFLFITRSAYRNAGQTPSSALCAVSYNHYAGDGNGCYNDWNIEPPFTPITESIQRAFIFNETLGREIERFQRFRSSGEPLVLGQSYNREVQMTAETILTHNAFVHLLMKGDFNRNTNQPTSSWNTHNWFFNKTNAPDSEIDDTHTAHLQYGDPAQAHQASDLRDWNSDETLLKLRKKNLGGSLQARVLANGGYLRVYDLEGLISTESNMVSQFFSETRESIFKCEPITNEATKEKYLMAAELARTFGMLRDGITCFRYLWGVSA